MLLMVEEGVRAEIYQAIISNIKANNKFMSNYVDGMISSYQQ